MRLVGDDHPRGQLGVADPDDLGERVVAQRAGRHPLAGGGQRADGPDHQLQPVGHGAARRVRVGQHRLLPQPGRLAVGVAPLRLLGRQPQVPRRLGRGVRRLRGVEVMRERDRVTRVQPFHRGGDAGVQTGAAQAGDVVVQRVAHERVREPQRAARDARLVEDARAQRGVQALDQRVLVDAGDRGQHVEGELATDHRGVVEHRLRRRGQPGDPAPHDVPHARRHLADRRVLTVVLQQPGDLPDEERVALGAPGDRVHRLVGERPRAQLVDQPGHRAGVQAGEREVLGPVPGERREGLRELLVDLGRLVRGHQQHRVAGQVGDQVREQRQHLAVRVVQVVEDHEQRAATRHGAEVAADGGAQPVARGRHVARGAQRDVVVEQRRELHGVVARREPVDEAREHLRPRLAGRAALALRAIAPGDRPAVAGEQPGDGARERGLADSRLAGYQREREPAGLRRGGGPAQPRQFLVAAQQSRAGHFAGGRDFPLVLRVRAVQPGDRGGFLDRHRHRPVGRRIADPAVPHDLVEEPRRSDHREHTGGYHCGFPGGFRECRLQRRRVEQPECQIDGRGSDAVRVVVDLPGVQCHPQAHLFGGPVAAVVPAQRRHEGSRQGLDERRLRQLRRGQDERAVAPVLVLAVGPGNTGRTECLLQRAIETCAHRNLINIVSPMITEPHHIHHEDGPMHRRPEPCHKTSRTCRMDSRIHHCNQQGNPRRYPPDGTRHQFLLTHVL